MSRANVLTSEFIEERVAKLPDAPGCWLWLGTILSNGYGKASFGGVPIGAHRASYAVFRGEPGALYVCHRCDNRSCVNPEHLFLGTAKDNAEDMVRKGRSTRGDRNAHVVLADRDLDAVRSSDLPYKELAILYGVCVEHIGSIRRGRARETPGVVCAKRRARGERSGKAKLTDELVREIRQSTLGARELGRKLGVSHSQVVCVRKRRTWGHVA